VDQTRPGAGVVKQSQVLFIACERNVVRTGLAQGCSAVDLEGGVSTQFPRDAPG
jgi:hypothetical protein